MAPSRWSGHRPGVLGNQDRNGLRGTLDHQELELEQMNRSSSFLLGMISGVVGLYLTMHFVLVRASDGFHVIPKIAAKLDMPYTDIRNFRIENWQRKQPLALAILKANKGYLLQDQALVGFRQATQRMLDQFSTPAMQAKETASF